MGTIEDIKKMQQEGKTEAQISVSLKQKGLTEEEASNLISEAKIKQAISSPESESSPLPENPQTNTNIDAPSPSMYSVGGYANSAPGVLEYSAQTSPGFEGMQPSMLMQGDQPQIPANQEYSPASYQPEQEYSQAAYQQPVADQQYAYDAYSQYQPYQEAMSSDLINEIAEQVVTEKLMEIQDRLEKTIDFKTLAESRISSMDERLRRIESIIDRLQLSLLQKMGEYVNNVNDVKYELEETQKSFKALVPQLKKIHSGGEEHSSHLKHQRP